MKIAALPHLALIAVAVTIPAGAAGYWLSQALVSSPAIEAPAKPTRPADAQLTEADKQELDELVVATSSKVAVDDDNEGASDESAARTDVETYDSAIAPLLDSIPEKSELKAVEDAIEATYAGKLDEARRAKAGIKDPAAKKLVEWYELRSGHSGANAQDIKSFRQSHPVWPQKGLIAASEESLFLSDQSAEKVFAFFESGDPQTSGGYAALARAHLEN